MTNPKCSAVTSDDLQEKEPLKIILAEDDKDDQELFIEALSHKSSCRSNDGRQRRGTG